MKKFKELMDGGKSVGRSSRIMSFQALAVNKRQEQTAPANNFADLQHKVRERTNQSSRYNNPPVPSTTIINPLGMIRPRKKQFNIEQFEKIQGVPITTSMNVSQEEPIPRLNTEERQEISQKMTDIKNDLISQLVKEANPNTLESVLAQVKKQLDEKTQEIVQEVLKKRQVKDIYLKARQEVKFYLSKKKDDGGEIKREKTLGTPCFQELSNQKMSSHKRQSNNKSMKSNESTGHKLTVIRKPSASTKSIKDTITMKRPKFSQDVQVKQFLLE